VRDFLNGILNFIVAESLTDDEFDSVESTIPIYDQATYDDLARILSARESLSTLQARLLAYYQARGVEIDALETGSSNIYLGSVL
jgi:hypothetical protein